MSGYTVMAIGNVYIPHVFAHHKPMVAIQCNLHSVASVWSAILCSLNRCILFSVFYVLPFGVINDDDDNDFIAITHAYCSCETNASCYWLTGWW